MESIYILVPVTMLFLGIAVAAYLWSVNSGQFDDLDKAGRSILFDDDATHGGDTTPHRKHPARKPAPGDR